MRKFLSFLVKPEFHIVLFAMGILLFNWPILSIADSMSVVHFHTYLFAGWAVIIGLLLLSSWRIKRTTK